EHVSLCGEDQGMGNAEVVVVEPLGAETLVHLAAGGQPLIARLPGLVELRTGDHVGLKLDRRRLHLFDLAGERIARDARSPRVSLSGPVGRWRRAIVSRSCWRTGTTTSRRSWRTACSRRTSPSIAAFGSCSRAPPRIRLSIASACSRRWLRALPPMCSCSTTATSPRW